MCTPVVWIVTPGIAVFRYSIVLRGNVYFVTCTSKKFSLLSRILNYHQCYRPVILPRRSSELSVPCPALWWANGWLGGRVNWTRYYVTPVSAWPKHCDCVIKSKNKTAAVFSEDCVPGWPRWLPFHSSSTISSPPTRRHLRFRLSQVLHYMRSSLFCLW